MSRHSRGFAITVAALTLAATVFPNLLFANHSWNGYHWARTANPFTVKLGDNVSGNWDSVLRTTSSDWTASSVLNTTIVAGSTQPATCSPTRGRVQVCNSTYGSTGWLGVAQVWTSGKHITQATVKLNDTYFNTSTYNTTAWRNLVSCQEVGHTFGLAHQDENFNNANLGTCMDYTNSPGSNQHPDQHDYDELVTIYSHVDSSNTTSAATPPPPAMNELDLAGPGQWGKLVSQSRNGGKSVYELDFGGGNKVFTFVTWTVERAIQYRRFLQQK